MLYYFYTTIQDLEDTIRDFGKVLGYYADTLKWLETVIAILAKIGINPDVKEMLGFDPWKYLKSEQARLKRAEKCLADIKAGSKTRPRLAIGRTCVSSVEHQGLVDHHKTLIDDLEYDLKDKFGLDAELAVKQANRLLYDNRTEEQIMADYEEAEWREICEA